MRNIHLYLKKSKVWFGTRLYPQPHLKGILSHGIRWWQTSVIVGGGDYIATITAKKWVFQPLKIKAFEAQRFDNCALVVAVGARVAFFCYLLLRVSVLDCDRWRSMDCDRVDCGRRWIARGWIAIGDRCLLCVTPHRVLLTGGKVFSSVMWPANFVDRRFLRSKVARKSNTWWNVEQKNVKVSHKRVFSSIPAKSSRRSSRQNVILVRFKRTFCNVLEYPTSPLRFSGIRSGWLAPT